MLAVEKIDALLAIVTRAEIEALPPARRRRLAQALRHIADIAECAVSDVAGPVELQICEEELGRSGLTVSEIGPRLAVPARPLHSILVDHGISRVDTMKIDVEGHEDRALIPFLRDAPRELWPADGSRLCARLARGLRACAQGCRLSHRMA